MDGLGLGNMPKKYRRRNLQKYLGGCKGVGKVSGESLGIRLWNKADRGILIPRSQPLRH